MLMLNVSWSPAFKLSWYRSTSLLSVVGSSPLRLMLWFRPSPVAVAVASVSPTSVAPSLRPLSAAMATPLLRSVLLPPAVDTTIRPAPTPAGTVRVSSCWSGVPLLPSTMVRTPKLPTPRPSMVMAKSLAASPVPSSTRVLPAATTPPTARRVGTICNCTLAPLPSTLTSPVRASAGTTMLRLLPSALALPVRVSVPSVPLSSIPWNCTSVLLLRPWPASTMVWPVTAEATAPSAGMPADAPPKMALNTLVGWVPTLAPLISA